MSLDIKWHRRFMTMAETARTWSKNQTNGVGAVVVSPDRRNISLGYSGVPKGVDDRSEIGMNKRCIVHAEVNAILNAGCSVEGWTLYSTKAPCISCIGAMIQAGIDRCISPGPDAESSWFEEHVIAKELATAGKLKYSELYL